MRYKTVTIMALALICISISFSGAYAEISIGGYSLVKTQRISFLKYSYTYRAKMTNSDSVPVTASATLKENADVMTIVDGGLDFGSVLSGETVKSYDTFTVSGSVFLPLFMKTLEWEINADPAYTDSDGDNIWDRYDICRETESGEPVNRSGCSSNDYLYRDYIEEDGFWYFTLTPLRENPIILKVLKCNAKKFENGYYLTGSVYVKTESDDEIPIRNCELYLEYGEKGQREGLTRVRGTVTHPVPDPNLLTQIPLTYDFFVGWLETAQTSKAVIGLDSGENIIGDLNVDLPLEPDLSYLFFTFSTPAGSTGGSAEIDMVLDPRDPAFLFHTRLIGFSQISTTQFSLGISAHGRIPFTFEGFDDEGDGLGSDSFFSRFTETFSPPDDEYDWLGAGFEGFNGFEEENGFGSHFFYEGSQTFSAYPGSISVDGKFYMNVDPDADRIFPLDQNGMDLMIGMSGAMDVTLNLLGISAIGLGSDAHAMISVKDDEKAVYFHGSLDADSELNADLGTFLPIDLSSSSGVTLSGLIDGENPQRNFLRLKGEFALDFNAGSLAALEAPDNLSGSVLKSFGAVSGELRVSNQGIWLQGTLKHWGSCTALNVNSGAIVELFLDTNFIGLAQNQSYLKLYGELGVSVFMPEIVNMPDGIHAVRLSSTQTPVFGSSSHVGLIVRNEGIFIGGSVESNLSIHDALRTGSAVKAELTIDFADFTRSGMALEGDMDIAVAGNFLDLSSGAKVFMGMNDVSVSGSLYFNIVDVSAISFDVSGGINASGLYLSGSTGVFQNLGLIDYEGLYILSISNDSVLIDTNGKLCGNITVCCVDILNVGLGVDVAYNPPRISMKDPFTPFITSLASCLGQTIEDIWDALTGGGCILPGTMILMADDSLKAIEDIKPGEYVMTTHGVRKVAVNDVATPVYPFEVVWDGQPTGVTVEHGFVMDNALVSFDPTALAAALPGIESTQGFPEEMASAISYKPISDEDRAAVYNLILEWSSSNDAPLLGYYANGRAVTDFIHPYCSMSNRVNPIARWVLSHREDILSSISSMEYTTLAELEDAVSQYAKALVLQKATEITQTSVNGEDGTELLRRLSTLNEADALILWKVTTSLGRILLSM